MTDDDIPQIQPAAASGAEAPGTRASAHSPATSSSGAGLFAPSPAQAGPDDPASSSASTGESGPAPHGGMIDGLRGRLGRMGALPLVCLIAALLILVDQLTKLWAVEALSGHARIPIIGDLLGLILVRNPGAAFSFATGQTWIFSIVAIVVTAIVMRVSKRLGSMWWAVTLGLVLGGAVGNLIDRLARAPGIFRGHVVDFIDYGGLFVGNVADIAIVGAAVAIVGLSLIGLEVDGSRAAEDAEGGAAARAALDGPPDRAEQAAGSPGPAAAAEPAGSPEPAAADGPDDPGGAGRAADCAEDPAPPPASGRTPGSAPDASDGPERRA